MVPTYVAFGIDRDDSWKEVIAVMPEFAAQCGRPDVATCYAHDGQHGSCIPHGLFGRYSQAGYKEYHNLLAELERIGYDVIVIPFDSIKDSKYWDMRVEQLKGL